MMWCFFSAVSLIFLFAHCHRIHHQEQHHNSCSSVCDERGGGASIENKRKNECSILASTEGKKHQLLSTMTMICIADFFVFRQLLGVVVVGLDAFFTCDGAGFFGQLGGDSSLKRA